MKAPGSKRLKLKFEPLSDFAFKFNLRRYKAAGLAGEAGLVVRRCLVVPPVPLPAPPMLGVGVHWAGLVVVCWRR
jgi:hypothetical protein